MKTLVSAIFGACALTMAAVGVTEPAQAGSNVGVYIGPNGVGVSVDRYRRSCRDYWYRHRHPYQCSRYYDYRQSYYPAYRYRYGHRHWRHRDHDRRYDRHDRRW